MNCRAENHVTITKDLFFEGMLRISRDSYGKFARKCMIFFGAIWAALLLFTLRYGGSPVTVVSCLVVVVVICLWISVLIPRNHAKKAWMGQQRLYGDSMERITRFYDDRLEISGDCAEKTVTYDDIKEIKESKNLILLICYDKMGILLSQDGFTKGDAATVRELIRKAQA